MIKVLEEPILQMQPEAIARPVKTAYGYHILKVTEVEEARQLSYEEVKEGIRKRLEGDRGEALYAVWMEVLRKIYPLQRFDAADQP